MERKRNTNVYGESFRLDIIEAVWNKAKNDGAFKYYKKDSCGATIKRTAFGDQSEYGWEIDHIKPVSSGGTDALINLQPLHWKNNQKKDENYPEWECCLI